MVQVAVMGHGVVGSGVVELLASHRESIASRAREEIRIKYILDLRDFPDSPFADRFVKDFNVILQDPEVKIVVEVMGGLKPAYDYVKLCLEAGKSVVTSNKELVAAKGADLLKTASAHNVNFLFEASVGGGIPIIRPLSQCLAANEVCQIAGILNGTTNFILTKMIREQMSFEDALALAQKLGYAERNPAADVEGHDACRKICILASLAFGKHVYPEQVHTEGISKVTLADVEYAASMDSVIKLIGYTKPLNNGKITALVAPFFLPKSSQLSNVDDVFNAIMVSGDATGDVLFYGKGAGKMPTASAVVADVIDCVKHLDARKYLDWSEGFADYVEDYRDTETRMYYRVCCTPEVLCAKLRDLFGNVTVLSRAGAPAGEHAFVTPFKKERDLLAQEELLRAEGAQILSKIRIGSF